MKNKLMALAALLIVTSGAMAQDSTYYDNHPNILKQHVSQKEKSQALSPNSGISPVHRLPHKYDNQKITPKVYRDTRLGSSSPQYSTYIKNKYGAGAVTTNPNKWGSGVLLKAERRQAYQSRLRTLSAGNHSRRGQSPTLTPNVYRDTRLGSSSPMYNTYAKNKYGTGAISTNPNKRGGSIPPSVLQNVQQTLAPADSVHNKE